jgi:hypothetical protein
MKKLLITVLMLLAHVCVAQVNLVPNPSFEDTVSCPNSGNQVDRAVGWYPSRNSPDYFNGCDWINGLLGVPSNTAGYQYAQTGNAYCGFISFAHNSPNYREIFTCQLVSPLVLGKKYNVSFYVSWAGKYRMASNKLGILFSTTNYDSSLNAPINNYCQVYTDSIITDSVNWTLIQKSFVADSNYSYLSVGNFFDSSMVDTIRPLPSSMAYYYVDDISVTEDTTTSIIDLNNSNGLKIYPNPVVDLIFIESSNNIVSSIELFDATNKLILKSTIEFKARSKLNFTQLKAGIYFLKVNLKNNTSFFHKLIKL